MITSSNENVKQYYGKSTDEKPTFDWLSSGSIFMEVDTGKVFIYDSETKTWSEL